MPKFFCDYCDVYLTHDSMSVRKAHNTGKNHLRNVVEYYQQIGHDRAQSVIDSITSSYAAEGQQGPAMFTGPPGPGMGGPPPPFQGMPNFNGPPPGFPPPNMMGRGMPFPNFPPPFNPSQPPPGGPPMPGQMPGQMPGGMPFPPNFAQPPQGMGNPSPAGQSGFAPPPGFGAPPAPPGAM